jgi:hypothetical protein
MTRFRAVWAALDTRLLARHKRSTVRWQTNHGHGAVTTKGKP